MKKTIRKAMLPLAVVLGLGLTSCKSYYYQVYEVKSNTLNQQENSLVYENEDLKILYNLWGEDGAVGFIVSNKTDKDVFVDMGQSFFILNGEANDYFLSREYVSTATVTTEIGLSQAHWSPQGFWPMQYYVPGVATAKAAKGVTRGVTTKEKEVICIPARSFKFVGEYKISPSLVQTCDRAKDYPRQTASIGAYSEGSSPLKFKNRITYYFDKSGSDKKHVENDFFVTSITNYSKKSATEKVKERIDCYNLGMKKVEHFKIGGPNKFYKSYRRTGSLF